MLQGTASNVGKSILTAGLCRIFKQDGYSVAPFKSQNMALNSFITKEGLEMGRAQVFQAEACGIDPVADMNPILLKPSGNHRCQVIVRGKVREDMASSKYHTYKPQLAKELKTIFSEFSNNYDIVVMEGAGSTAEINLREHDIANMGMAEIADAPVIIVGDIDRGGVFASLAGTMMLLSEEERRRVKGVIINKFRGRKELLEEGIKMLEEIINVPVLGVIPYSDIKIEDEDSEVHSYEYAGDNTLLNSLVQCNYALILCLYAKGDIGVNYYGWTEAQLSSFLTDYGFSSAEAAHEMYTAFIANPANYCKYVLGFLGFEELKNQAQKDLGDNFSLKEFHRYILETGPVHIDILFDYLKNWENRLVVSSRAA